MTADGIRKIIINALQDQQILQLQFNRMRRQIVIVKVKDVMGWLGVVMTVNGILSLTGNAVLQLRHFNLHKLVFDLGVNVTYLRGLHLIVKDKLFAAITANGNTTAPNVDIFLIQPLHLFLQREFQRRQEELIQLE